MRAGLGGRGRLIGGWCVLRRTTRTTWTMQVCCGGVGARAAVVVRSTHKWRWLAGRVQAVHGAVWWVQVGSYCRCMRCSCPSYCTQQANEHCCTLRTEQHTLLPLPTDSTTRAYLGPDLPPHTNQSTLPASIPYHSCLQAPPWTRFTRSVASHSAGAVAPLHTCQ
jgi:hypothetical protein